MLTVANATTVNCSMCDGSVSILVNLAQLLQQSCIQKQGFTFITRKAQCNSWVQLDSFTMLQQRLL